MRGASKRNLKRQKVTIGDDCSDDQAENVDHDGDIPHAHPFYKEEYAKEQCPPQGIKWIMTNIPRQLIPNRIHILDE